MVKKIIGSDTEIGAFLLGSSGRRCGSADEDEPAWLLLEQFSGVRDRPASKWSRSTGQWSGWNGSSSYYGGESGYEDDSYRDYGRLFLDATGGQAYYDSSHCEVVTGECTSAFELATASRALLRLVRVAEKGANERLAAGARIIATANNTDGRVSWGHHISVAWAEEAQERIVRLPLATLSFASFLASSLILGGQGAIYGDRFVMLSRGPFFASIAAPQTTFQRPIVNTRMESLAGPGIARHHVIFFDTTLNAFQTALKGGLLQIALALLEADQLREPDFLLEDPLGAIESWNSDLTFQAPSRTASGRSITAVEMQRLFLEQARRCADKGLFEDAIPDVNRILDMWESTLDLLAARDFPALSRRLDWALKWKVLTTAMELDPQLGLGSPEVRVLDTMYSAVGEDGLFWAYEASGQVDLPIEASEIDRLMREPVETTRAWGRAQLLRRFPEATIERADWDRITWGSGPDAVTFYFPDPGGCNRAELEPVLEHCRTLEELAAHPAVQQYVQRRCTIQ